MNKGSTVELAIAVHNAGGYPSLCSWTYNSTIDRMKKDLDIFVESTGSNHIHLSFELHEYPSSVIQDLILSYKIPTVELIYGDKNILRPTKSDRDLTNDVIKLLDPIKSAGTKVFKRIYDPVDPDLMTAHLLDGFCIKGAESAGFTSQTPVKELFLTQRELTPQALLIPYGGVGTAAQVKDYIDLGAEIVAVGTVLALSREGPLSDKTKQTVINKQSSDLVQFTHKLDNIERKQNVLQFEEYQGPDDDNRTIGLVRGIHGKQTGHVYLGHGIDHVHDIKSCQQIIKELMEW